MSEIDPLIKRELEWLSVSVSESRDLAPIIIAKVRRQRALRALASIGALLLVSVLSIVIYEGLKSDPVPTNNAVKTDNSTTLPSIVGVESEYDITFEQAVGDDSAISGAVGVGEERGGLYASGLKVEWGKCGSTHCPVKWTLVLENRGRDVVTAKPGISIFIDHQPFTSDYRPTVVLPGESARLIYPFPEFAENTDFTDESTWQWNWYLAR
jgi:hypothetical protein